MTFGEPKSTMGLLLQPLAAAVEDATSGLVVGDVYQGEICCMLSRHVRGRLSRQPIGTLFFSVCLRPHFVRLYV